MSENILSSKTKSQLLAYFILNPHRYFSAEEIRQQVGARNLKDDLVFLLKHDFILGDTRRGRRYYALNKNAFIEPKLKSELVKGSKKLNDAVTKEIKKMRGFEQAIYTGFLKGHHKQVCDILLVGEFTQKAVDKFEKSVQKIIGDDINFAILSKEEFEYRKNIFDRFVKDIFENEHFVITKDKR